MKKLSKDFIKNLIYESKGIKKISINKERVREIIREEVDRGGRLKNEQ
jgi:hypothetical protein